MKFPKKTKIDRDLEKKIRLELKPKIKRIKGKDEKLKLRRIFNEYIRVRDSIDTTGTPFSCKCCTCGQIRLNDKNIIHAGHFIKSDHNLVTFDETNVHGQCIRCNSYNGGNEAEYSHYIIKKYGLEHFEFLLSQKMKIKQFKSEELIQMQRDYSKKLDDLLIKFPNYKRKSTIVK